MVQPITYAGQYRDLCSINQGVAVLVLDGKLVAEKLFHELKQKIADFNKKFHRLPGLSVILVGEDPASQVYVRNKAKMCEQLGMLADPIILPESTSKKELIGIIDDLNKSSKVDGILVQLPLPKHLNPFEIIEKISPDKDVDVLTYTNIGKLWAGQEKIAPCTPSGIIELLKHYQISLKSKNAVVVGRSQIVGMPMANLLLKQQCSVEICHSNTQNLREHTQRADLVIVAAGKERFLGREDFKKGAVIIDVGIHRNSQNKLCGDVRFEELGQWAFAASPVPKGVGPMTIQMLMQNTYNLAKDHES